MKKKLKKSAGERYPIEYSNGIAKIASTKFIFPETKQEIEEKIARLFLKSANDLENFLPEKLKLIPNNEYDLDFLLKGKNYKCLLELTESIPIGIEKGGYNNSPLKVYAGEYSEKIISQILKKSRKYVGIETDIILLIFSSDYRASPCQNTEALVKDFLNKIPLNFKMIYFIYPSLEDAAFITRYYPNSQIKLKDLEIDRLKRGFSLVLKPNL